MIYAQMNNQHPRPVARGGGAGGALAPPPQFLADISALNGGLFTGTKSQHSNNLEWIDSGQSLGFSSRCPFAKNGLRSSTFHMFSSS